MKKSKGFTLIELVMVIVILGILAAMVLPRFVNLSDAARRSATQGSLGAIRAAVAVQYASNAVNNVTTNNGIPTTVEGTMFQDGSVPVEQYVGNNNAVVVGSTEVPATATAGGWWYNSGNGRAWVNHSGYTTW